MLLFCPDPAAGGRCCSQPELEHWGSVTQAVELLALALVLAVIAKLVSIHRQIEALVCGVSQAGVSAAGFFCGWSMGLLAFSYFYVKYSPRKKMIIEWFALEWTLKII